MCHERKTRNTRKLTINLRNYAIKRILEFELKCLTKMNLKWNSAKTWKNVNRKCEDRIYKGKNEWEIGYWKVVDVPFYRGAFEHLIRNVWTFLTN